MEINPSKGVYYNYYNVKGRYSPQTPQQTALQKLYTKAENRIESNNHNPDSEQYQAVEKLNDMYYEASVKNRAVYKDESSLKNALGRKYLSGNAYSQYSYSERRAMYENELNMTMFGNCQNLNDPRLGGAVHSVADDEAKAYNRKSVNEQINGILSNGGIDVSMLGNMTFSLDSYNHTLTVLGISDDELVSDIEELLNNGRNSTELFYHILQSSYSDVDEDVKTKYKVIQSFKNITGSDLRSFTQSKSGLYDAQGNNAVSLYEQALKASDKVPSQFKGVDLDVFKSNLSRLMDKDFSAIPELNLVIGFSDGALDDSVYNADIMKRFDMSI